MQIGFNTDKIINGLEDLLAVYKARIVFKCKAFKQTQIQKIDDKKSEYQDWKCEFKRKLKIAKLRVSVCKQRRVFENAVKLPGAACRTIGNWFASIEYRKVGRVSLSFVLCLSLIIGCSISGFALDDATATEKEEVVYVNLNSDGSVDEIYVVNIFNLNESGEIIDYGAYEEVRNMSSNDNIELVNEKVTIYTTEQKLYYEGLIKGNALPWVFDIHYYLNDAELDADDLGGKTGALRITLDISQNEESSLGFFENYCLQINLTLDTDNAKNIVAEGATMANVGSSKQITYIALPNQEHNYEITADVEQFTMSGFEINGLKMNVGLTNIDSSVLSSSLNELEDGVARLANGAAQLADGAGELSDGAADLLAGINELRSGVATLKDGAGTLQSGTKTLRDGTAQLASGASTFESEVYSGVSKISSSITDMMTEGASGLAESLGQLGDLDFEELLGMSIDSDTILKFLEEGVGSGEILNLLLDAINAELVKYPDPDSDMNKMLSLMAFILEYKMADITEAAQVIEKYIGYVERFVVIVENADYIIEAGGINMVRDEIDAIIEQNHEECQNILNDIKLAFIERIMSNDLISTLLSTVMTKISTEIAATLGDYAAGLSTQLSAVAASLVSSLLYGVSQIGDAADQLYDGANQLYSGAASLNEGLGQTLTGVDALQGGAKQLYDGTISLEEGCIQLKNGSEELRLAVSSSGQGITSKIIEAIDEIFGTDFVAPSFVDERNETVNFVQFVMKTQSIVPPGLEEDNTSTEQTTFWTRFMKLFGVERREGAVND